MADLLQMLPFGYEMSISVWIMLCSVGQGGTRTSALTQSALHDCSDTNYEVSTQIESRPQHEPLSICCRSSACSCMVSLNTRNGSSCSMTNGRFGLQAIINKEVSQLLTKQEAEEQLASLQQRREALKAERDGKQQQRGQLELQLMRFAQQPRSSTLAESQPGSSHQAAARLGDGCSHQGQGSSANSPGNNLVSHQHQHEPHVSASPEQLSCEKGEEELMRQAAALDDAVDTCQTQMQYLDSCMAECKTVSAPHHPQIRPDK